MPEAGGDNIEIAHRLNEAKHEEREENGSIVLSSLSRQSFWLWLQ